LKFRSAMMTKRVVLRCDGELETGFQVTLEIGEDPLLSFVDIQGALPPAPELAKSLEQWRQHYRQLSAPARIALQQITIRMGSSAPGQVCRQQAEALQQQMHRWLESPSFHAIEKQLRESLDRADPVRVLLRATDLRLHHLPWHLWEFIEHYPHAEMALSTPPAKAVAHQGKPGIVRILAILGDRQGIDTDRDRQILEDLPNAEVLFLVESSRQQLHHYLWEEAWDILFFAGHSNTEAQQGRLYINPGDSLTIAELKYGLRQAIARGLQLAIFNSCDGLGLAYELEQLHLPQLIVMREPIPDRVAQEFLKHFLTTYAQGQALYPAVRAARERLQGLEGEYPCATWLPIICQNPAVLPPTWQSLRGEIAADQAADEKADEADGTVDLSVSSAAQSGAKFGSSSVANPLQSWIRPLLTSLVMTGLIVGVRSIGLLQPLELAAFDTLLQLRPDEPPDARLLVVLITDEDVQAQSSAERNGSLSDRTLEQLLTKLVTYQPRAIGLDVYRDHPVGKTASGLVNRLRKSDRWVAVCKVGDPENKDRGVAPPPEMTDDQIAFSDIVFDPDNVVRRHLLAMTPSPASRCVAPYALSLQLALRYLDTQGITLQYPNATTWQLGKLQFHPLQARTGGYQSVDQRGHQILLNYRSLRLPEQGVGQVTLGQVLAGQINPAAIKDRIVLIGTIAEGTHDYWLTPYFTPQGNKLAIPGVVLQAQMTSQLVSAALDGRPLLWTWELWTEIVWILSWAMLGGILAQFIRKPMRLGLAIIMTIVVLCSTCLLLLIQLGGWIPLVPSAIALTASGVGVKLGEKRK
jgi:CHASE2 domain-containing sensor protein